MEKSNVKNSFFTGSAGFINRIFYLIFNIIKIKKE